MDQFLFECSCCELKHGVCAETTRQTPGRHTAPHLPDHVPAIDKDEIDGEAHPEGVHRFARYDPEAFAFAQRLPAQQTSRASRSAISYLHAACHNALRSKVANLAPGTRIVSRCRVAAC
jgi:hypothetical protein